MGCVGSRDTKPELLVRSLLHRLGFRFRVNDGSLPGSPDIVLRRHGSVIFVHGCFWHQHSKCSRSKRPSSRVDYWNPKLEANVKRDTRVRVELRRLGWRVLTVWECKVGNVDRLIHRLENAFG
jgi:DNA mismatch endonuclease (patch repair protein)